MLNTIRNYLVSILAPKYRAVGIDGSHWWGWFKPELATRPIDFVIIKATQGSTMIDPALGINWEGAKRVGVRGAYHYQKYGASWLAQAEFFLRAADRYDFHILALDVEKAYNELAFASPAAGDTFFSDMRRILDYWKFKKPDKKVVLYTNTDIYANFIYPAIKRLYGMEGEQWLESLDLWLANYNGQNVDGEPLMPANRASGWTFWQYSSNGKKADYGTNGDVDLNVFNGRVEELYKWAGITNTDPPPPVEPPAPQTEPETEPETWTGHVVALERLIARSYPARADGTDTGRRLIPGEKVSGRLWTGNGYVWMKLDDSVPETIKGKWVAVRKEGGDQFIKLDPQPLPPGPTIPQLWRVKHDIELTKGLWRDNLPEVHPIFPNHHSEFGKDWQLLSRGMNPRISANKWTAVYHFKLWIDNNQGYGMESDPRANYVLRENLTCDNPRVEALTTGGSFHTGTVEGPNLILETLDVNHAPTLDWILARPWFFVYAVTVDSKGTPRRFPQGLQPNGEVAPIIHPLIADRRKYPKLTIPLSKLEKWDMSKGLPDPFKVYEKA
jgi:Lyzozyme M1 (1,4-beta-N-acetylmuramidase)